MKDLASYAAPCVRACALRTGLLSRDEWRSLSAAESTSAALAWLSQRGAIGQGSTNVIAAERGAHQRVIHDATSLLRFARGDLMRLLRFFVQYYDLLNVETVILGLFGRTDRPPDDDALYDAGPFGLLDRADLHSVTHHAALSRALRRTWLAGAFDTALLQYREAADQTGLVEAVEVAFFSEWIAAAERCGFRLSQGTDGSGLAVFLAARVIEAAVRVKVHREAESKRVVDWLSLIASGAGLEACLKAVETDQAEEAFRGLTRMLLPASSRWTFESEAEAGLPELVLQRIIHVHANRATKGIRFHADFLASYLIRLNSQARGITVVLESKAAGLPAEACCAFMGQGT